MATIRYIFEINRIASMRSPAAPKDEVRLIDGNAAMLAADLASGIAEGVDGDGNGVNWDKIGSYDDKVLMTRILNVFASGGNVKGMGNIYSARGEKNNYALAKDVLGTENPLGKMAIYGGGTFENAKNGTAGAESVDGETIEAMLKTSHELNASRISKAPAASSNDYAYDFGGETLVLNSAARLSHTGKKGEWPGVSSGDVKIMAESKDRSREIGFQRITPEITMYFGDIRETADVDEVMGKLAERLEEVAASSLREIAMV
ncbi:MAG: hypothetical protein LBL35_03430 [Clostridiales bacterium]|nr:hypothetical protein [Clostridiales bacterium]